MHHHSGVRPHGRTRTTGLGPGPARAFRESGHHGRGGAALHSPLLGHHLSLPLRIHENLMTSYRRDGGRERRQNKNKRPKGLRETLSGRLTVSPHISWRRRRWTEGDRFIGSRPIVPDD
ncbi:hypothetical protein EVAR_27106_1 [Eumeta japonica]|uniref:Uncharacterized protein n=1 Tax=Eumeta variegata TaxID=151549 RepID=A0A4C1VJI1_EUMVA|nr:hypothetical protein EVAR_27106_1 [Eumeta japonica]